MARLFGTDGVRGVVNEMLTPELAYHLGRAAAMYFSKKRAHPTFLIGRDTRISGGMLECALAAGITSMGGNVVIAGVIPTPGVAYLVRHHEWDAGVVISASHNPFQDNGIKFFNHEGFKLPDAVEDEIEEYCRQSGSNELARPTGAEIGRIEYHMELAHEYADFIVSTVTMSLEGMTIVYDGANGAASVVGPEVLKRLGATVIPIHVNPNGTNINEQCGSTHLESLQETVIAHKADLGIANDGDADRCLFVDEKGQVLDGDQIMLLCALKLKEAGQLHDNMIVSTVMSNIGFHKAAKELGMKTCTTAVGDRYVLERMLEDDYSIGGEQSGHVIFLQYNSTGDGLLTATQLVSIVKEKGKPLSELAGLMTKYPQQLVNVRVATKTGWETNTLIAAAIATGELELGENGRILVRPSGTEPLIRVMAEGTNQEQLNQICNQIAAVIAQEQGLAQDI
ncbi:phosphoglucosamine mutase [Veillonella montpellierensis DNF00314]|uniref:Phosphoglucosamine mutase n=1 Tax=Veillonella montpellierensis DNF00314 TaxID=1401067 RepID=A0A096AJA5_9FIRM|nr:phosphoglucosamine mutase [Veillonella montpellierensis]KGF46910.1 phosphoglucosamine mutase [Veillonella montpellierensis DNF00314]